MSLRLLKKSAVAPRVLVPDRGVTALCGFPFLLRHRHVAEAIQRLVRGELLDQKNPDFSNYAAVLSQASFLRAIGNSLVVALSVVTLALFLSLTAAYALGRVKFRGRGTVLMMVLGVSMFPQVAVLSGLFEVIRALGLYNTSWALILSYTIFHPALHRLGADHVHGATAS